MIGSNDNKNVRIINNFSDSAADACIQGFNDRFLKHWILGVGGFIRRFCMNMNKIIGTN